MFFLKINGKKNILTYNIKQFSSRSVRVNNSLSRSNRLITKTIYKTVKSGERIMYG